MAASGEIIYRKFTTRDANVPATLTSGVVSIYKDASTTESTAGVTLTADFDSRTGLNHVSIDTGASPTFYANGSRFEIVLTAGTVGGTTVISEVVGSFDLAASGASAPTAAQVATAVWDEINTGATHNLTNSTGRQLRTITGNTDAIYPTSGTVNLTAATSTTATLDALASAVAQAYQWDVISILSGTGAGQSRIITNYTTGRVATVSPAFTTTPDATSTFEITPTASVQVVSYVAGQDPASLVLITAANKLSTDASGRVDLGKYLGAASAGAPGYAGIDWGHVNAPTTTVALTNTTISSGQVVASVSGAVGSVTGAVGSVTGSVGSVTGSVGSVTGLTPATIATAVWTDTTAGDFTTLTSPGKIIFSQLGGAFTTTSSSVFSTAALANAPTGGTAPTAAVVAAAVWDLATSGHTTSGTFGAAVVAIKSDTSSIISTLTTVASNVTTIVTNTTGTGDVNVVSFSSAALAQFFTLNTGEKYAAPYSDAVPGSVVYEIVSNAGIDEAQLLIDIDDRLSGTHGAGDWTGGGGGGLDAAGIRNAIGLASANLDVQLAAIKSDTSSIISTLTTVAGDVTTIITNTTGTLDAAGIRAAIGMAAANLDGQLAGIDAHVLSRLAASAYVVPLDAVGIRNAIGLVTNNLDIQLGLIPTAAQNADKLLGRNVGGSADGVRTVSEALYFLRNKWTIIGGTLTVYAANDSSVAWTGGVSQNNATPVTGIDPA